MGDWIRHHLCLVCIAVGGAVAELVVYTWRAFG